VIAFELLAGRVPFSAESPLAVLHHHVSTPPPPLSTVLPGTAASVDAVLSRGLAKKPEDRFGSCAAFVAALGAALAVPGAAATVPQAMEFPSQVATIVSAPALSPAALAAPASLAKGAPEGAPKDTNRDAKVLIGALLLLSAGGGIYFLLRGMGAGHATTGAPTIATPEISSSLKETPATPAASTSAPAAATSEISSKVNEPASLATAALSTGAEAPGAGTAPPANARRPQLPIEEKNTAPRSTTGNSAREESPPAHPKQTSFPPLLSGAAFSGDTQLAAAWESLDTRGRARLTRADFVSAMGTAREALGRRPTAEVLFLDAYTRAGVAYADGRNAEAWQLLARALRSSGPAADTRVLRFVADEVQAMGPNPGPDAEWVLGLAFGDARGKLGSELDKAQARAPRSPRVQEARALSNR